MSKRNLMNVCWDLATQTTGEHKTRCFALADLTGLSWACRHFTDKEGQRALYYIVPRGPEKSSGDQFVKLINHKLYDDVPIFEMVGDQQDIIGVKVDSLQAAPQNEIDYEETASELRRVLTWLTAEGATNEVISKARTSAAKQLRGSAGL